MRDELFNAIQNQCLEFLQKKEYGEDTVFPLIWELVGAATRLSMALCGNDVPQARTVICETFDEYVKQYQPSPNPSMSVLE